MAKLQQEEESANVHSERFTSRKMRAHSAHLYYFLLFLFSLLLFGQSVKGE